ncbi:hypothetical protein G6F50_015293 [Rhizopus delemar]|uniref:Uncharacterized protein n=1 Tax=Rhizopus delemar TaxID=936053 RepID=A0A9P7C425_9FUNG|nr:hypothetical protein G6F50_015293 [Rhizopus delemar]
MHPFDADEHPAQQQRRQQRQVHAQGMQPEFAQPQQGQGQRRQHQAEAEHAAEVQVSALAVAFRQHARAQHEGRQRQHATRREHAAPPQCLQQKAGKQRPQCQPCTECRAQQGKGAGARRSLPGLRQCGARAPGPATTAWVPGRRRRWRR